MNNISSKITSCTYECIANAIPNDADSAKIASIFEQIITDKLTDKPQLNSPFLYNVSGIPGAGKSTVCKELIASEKIKGAVYISFDEIMEDSRLPYKAEEEQEPHNAFERWELPARIAGYELLNRAVKNRNNILFEHSSANSHHINLFNHLLLQGYLIHFRYINTDENEALKRIQNRKRHTPQSFVSQRAKQLSILLPQYEQICTTFKII